MPAKIVVPELGESVLEATVGHWQKKEGDRVSAGEVLVSLETDKVDLEVGAERSGILARIERQEGEDVKIGDVLGVIEDAPAGSKGDAAAPAASTPPESRTPKFEPREVAATPSARRLAREQGVDLAQVRGADGGRVTKEDVAQHLEVAAAPAAAQSVG